MIIDFLRKRLKPVHSEGHGQAFSLDLVGQVWVSSCVLSSLIFLFVVFVAKQLVSCGSKYKNTLAFVVNSFFKCRNLHKQYGTGY